MTDRADLTLLRLLLKLESHDIADVSLDDWRLDIGDSEFVRSVILSLKRAGLIELWQPERGPTLVRTTAKGVALTNEDAA